MSKTEPFTTRSEAATGAARLSSRVVRVYMSKVTFEQLKSRARDNRVSLSSQIRIDVEHENARGTRDGYATL